MGLDGMVIIGHRYSKSTFGANKIIFDSNSVCPFFLKTAFLLLLGLPINLCGLFWIFVHPIKIQYLAQHNIFSQILPKANWSF